MKEINYHVELNNFQKAFHWINAFILSGFLLTFTIVDSKEVYDIPIFTIIVSLLILLLFISKYTSTKFTKINIKSTVSQFSDAVKATSKILEWNIEEASNDKIVAYKKVNNQNDGLMITILKKEDYVLINSMIKPYLFSHPFSFGKNKHHIKFFTYELKNAVKNIDVRKQADLYLDKLEEEFWEESELSAINTLQRISAYVLIILFTILSIYLISQFEIKSTIISLTILYFCFSYIYYDLKIINLKNKKNSKKVK